MIKNCACWFCFHFFENNYAPNCSRCLHMIFLCHRQSNKKTIREIEKKMVPETPEAPTVVALNQRNPQNLVDDLFIWNVQLRLLELLQPGSAADSSRVYIYWPRAFRWAIQMKTPGSRFDWNPARTRHRDLAKVQMVWCGPMGPVFDYGLGLVNLCEIQDPFGSWSLYDFADCEVCLCVRVCARCWAPEFRTSNMLSIVPLTHTMAALLHLLFFRSFPPKGSSLSVVYETNTCAIPAPNIDPNWAPN